MQKKRKPEYEIVKILKEHNIHISCAESCTGGLIISTIINVCGASNVVNQSFVTYSNASKTNILNVNPNTILMYGVQSMEVAKEMAQGIKQKYHDEVIISVTGYTKSLKKEENDGLCFYSIIIGDRQIEESIKVLGSRNTIRLRQTRHILNRLLEILKIHYQ